MLQHVSQTSSSDNLSEQSENRGKSTRPTKPNKPVEQVYFMNILVNMKLLEDPNNKQQRFSNNLWAEKQIKGIKHCSHYLEVNVSQKRATKRPDGAGQTRNDASHECTKMLPENHKEQLNQIKNNFDSKYPLLKKKLADKPSVNHDKQFDEWLQKMKSKSFVGWYVPLREEGPKLRKFVISKEALKMMGYQPHQFSFQIEKYTQITADFWSGEAYKSIFFMYTKIFKKFMAWEVDGQGSFEQCVKESYLTVITQFTAKGQVGKKLEMVVYMPNILTICYELVRVIEEHGREDEIKVAHRTRTSEINVATFNSLSSITVLPKCINPANTDKICSYVEIAHGVAAQNKAAVAKNEQDGSQKYYQP